MPKADITSAVSCCGARGGGSAIASQITGSDLSGMAIIQSRVKATHELPVDCSPVLQVSNNGSEVTSRRCTWGLQLAEPPRVQKRSPVTARY
jgi:hypothetical protein